MPDQPKQQRLSRQDRSRLRTLKRAVEKSKGDAKRKAKSLLRSAEKAAKAAAKEAERYNRQQLAVVRKAFRKQWSILRRKGIVKADARSVAFNARNKKTVAEYAHVLSGKEKTFRVKNAAQRKALAAQGVRIRNGTAIVSKDYRIRNGKIFSAKKKGRRILSIDAGELSRDDVAQAVRNAFRKIKPKYGLAFRFQGYNSYQIYPDAELMIMDLLDKYFLAFEKFNPDLEFFDPELEFEQYQALRTRETLERQLSKDTRKRNRARERRVAKKFLASMVKTP